MSELEESALTVSEAARVLSNSRYNKDDETEPVEPPPTDEKGKPAGGAANRRAEM